LNVPDQIKAEVFKSHDLNVADYDDLEESFGSDDYENEYTD